MSTLEHIDFKGCTQLRHLPQGITAQRRLRYLNLVDTSLRELPSYLEPLCLLEQLIIGSNRLRELPCSVASLINLKELHLLGCLKLKHISIPIERLTCLERLEICGSKVPILLAGISLLKHLKVLTIFYCPIENFSLDNNVMDALTDLNLCGTYISAITIPAGACPMLKIVDLSYNCRLRQVQLSQSTIVKLNLDGCEKLQYLNLPTLGRLKFLNIKRCGNVAIQTVAECRSLEEIRVEACRLTIEAAWKQLEHLNSFEFSQAFHSFCMRRWPKYSERWNKMMAVTDFENLLNSFHGVREVPSTATDKSPLLLEKVHSHSAILMCFITQYYDHDFVVRFEACNGGGRSKEFVTTHPELGLWVHVYMWTQHSTLFRDEDNFDNVSIYKKGRFHVEGSERGLILTFSSENDALHVLNQIIPLKKWIMDSLFRE